MMTDRASPSRKRVRNVNATEHQNPPRPATRKHLNETAPRMLFLGSFPPRECGIATFMKDVVDSYDATFGTRSAVIAIDEPGGEGRSYPDQVVACLVQGDRASYGAIIDFVNAYPCD